MASGDTGRKAFVALLKILITVVVVLYVVQRLGWGRITGTLGRADRRWLLGGLTAFLFSGYLGAVQWRLLLASKGIKLHMHRAVVLYFIGMFFNNFMFGVVAGDAVRVALIKSDSGSGRGGLAATFLDRFAGLWAMTLFAVVGSVLLMHRGVTGQGKLLTASVALMVAFIVFCMICTFIVSRRAQRLMFAALAALPIPAGAKVTAVAREVVLEVEDRHMLLPVVLLSLLIQFLRIGVHVVCAASLGLLTVANFQYFLVFVPVLAVMMLVPMPFGVKEVGGAGLFGLAGFGEDALVMEFLASLTGIVAGLAGGVLFVTTRLRIANKET